MIVHICSRMNLLVKSDRGYRVCMRFPCFIIPAVPIPKILQDRGGCLHVSSCFSFECGLNQVSRTGSILLHSKCALVVRMLGKQGVKWWP